MMLRKTKALITMLLAVAIGGNLAIADIAAAAQKGKLTYAEAWTHCKALLDKEGAYGTTTHANWRTVRGGACMGHYGYRL
jgi:hypothetical protein